MTTTESHHTSSDNSTVDYFSSGSGEDVSESTPWSLKWSVYSSSGEGETTDSSSTITDEAQTSLSYSDEALTSAPHVPITYTDDALTNEIHASITSLVTTEDPDDGSSGLVWWAIAVIVVVAILILIGCCCVCVRCFYCYLERRRNMASNRRGPPRRGETRQMRTLRWKDFKARVNKRITHFWGRDSNIPQSESSPDVTDNATSQEERKPSQVEMVKEIEPIHGTAEWATSQMGVDPEQETDNPYVQPIDCPKREGHDAEKPEVHYVNVDSDVKLTFDISEPNAEDLKKYHTTEGYYNYREVVDRVCQEHN